MMAGSAAEERIRAKVEAALRRRAPNARIIHELVLVQGGVRIDLAAVEPGRLIFAEIKSEKDTLNRLQEQVRSATSIGAETWLCLAEKWRPTIDAMKGRDASTERVPLIVKGVQYGHTYKSTPNPGYIPQLAACEIRYETDDGLTPLDGHATWFERHRRINPYTLLNMLWAEELRQLAGCGSRANRDLCINTAADALTGRQVREGVCAALRARAFPRADPAVAA